jgi:hypothetical protein
MVMESENSLVIIKLKEPSGYLMIPEDGSNMLLHNADNHLQDQKQNFDCHENLYYNIAYLIPVQSSQLIFLRYILIVLLS